MMRVSTAHLRESEPLPDGSFRAVTVMNRSPHGVMVWAGALHPNSADVGPEDVSPSNYIKRETVSFMAWTDVVEYFEGREYELLVAQLMRETSRKRSDLE